MNTLVAVIGSAIVLTAGIATIVVTYLLTQQSNDVTIVANVGIISIAVVWVIAFLIAAFADDM